MALGYLKLTLGAGATQFISTHTPIHDVQIQNNAAHLITVGTKTVAVGSGIQLPAGTSGAGGTLYLGPFDQWPTNLEEFYAIGTQGDVLDVVYNT